MAGDPASLAPPSASFKAVNRGALQQAMTATSTTSPTHKASQHSINGPSLDSHDVTVAVNTPNTSHHATSMTSLREPLLPRRRNATGVALTDGDVPVPLHDPTDIEAASNGSDDDDSTDDDGVAHRDDVDAVAAAVEQALAAESVKRDASPWDTAQVRLEQPDGTVALDMELLHKLWRAFRSGTALRCVKP